MNKKRVLIAILTPDHRKKVLNVTTNKLTIQFMNYLIEKGCYINVIEYQF